MHARALVALAVLVALVVPPAGSPAPPARGTSVSLAVKSDLEHAKKGSDGKWHDAYLPAHFTVRAGSRVTVTVRNYDNAVHTFTAKPLGLDVKIRPGTASAPRATTFAFTAPKPGTYTWWCAGPCDAWAMTHFGFMLGRVTVVP